MYGLGVRACRRVIVLAAATATCALPAAASASLSPRALVASSIAAARAQRSVHYVSSASLGDLHLSQIGDVGRTRGMQRITYRKGAQTGHVTVLVVAGTAFVRGDAFTLRGYMGFKPASAAKYAGRWIRVPHADRAYASYAADVTLLSTVEELRISPPFMKVPDTTIGRSSVHGVEGKLNRQVATLYMQARGLPLPVAESFSQGAARGGVVLGKWNEPVHVAVPRAAVPIAQTR